MDIFPVELFNPASIRPRPDRMVVTGGRAISGDEDVIQTDGGGRWRVDFAGIDLFDDEQVAAWNAWDMHLGGGATDCIVPIAVPRQGPLPLIGTEFGDLSDLDPESDTPYYPNAAHRAEPAVIATMAGAAHRATQITITVTQGRRLRGGEPFTLVHSPDVGERLYRVSKVISRSGQSATVNIWPPLRESVDGSADVDFDWPRFRARQDPSSEMAPEFVLGNAEPVSVSFVEVP